MSFECQSSVSDTVRIQHAEKLSSKISQIVLWKEKLSDLFVRHGSVITCEKKPVNVPGLNNLENIEPYEMYQLVSQFILQHNPSASTDSSNSTQEIISAKGATTYWESFSSWLNRTLTLLLPVSWRAPFHIGIVGAGLDNRGERCVYDDLWGSNIICDRYHVTMRSGPVRMMRIKAANDQLLFYDDVGSYKILYEQDAVVFPLFERTTRPGNFTDQAHRIHEGPLFNIPPDHTPRATEDMLSSMVVGEEYTKALMGIDGLIYTVDARIPESQFTYLYHELTTLISGFYYRNQNQIPVVILYVTPSQTIPTCADASENRDEGSTGLPLSLLSRLRLFELENPWRLQRCVSSDGKAILQSIKWMQRRNNPIV